MSGAREKEILDSVRKGTGKAIPEEACQAF